MSKRPHVHCFKLPPQGNSVVTIGVCACGAKTGPLLNVWTNDEYTMGETQKANIKAAAKKRWAARRAERAREREAVEA